MFHLMCAVNMSPWVAVSFSENKTKQEALLLFCFLPCFDHFVLFLSTCFFFFYYYLHCPFLYKLIKQLFSAEYMIYLARCGNIYMCFLIMAVQVHHVVLQ